MSRRRSDGLMGIWIEAQRQQQRQREARHRAEAQARRERERLTRARQSELERDQREREKAHRRHRTEEARRRTEELDAVVAALQTLLATGCQSPAFDVRALRRSEALEPFAPGQLAVPVPLPDPARYQAPGGWGSGARRERQEARARYEQDWRAAHAAEEHRQRQLADYQRRYDQWAHGQLAEVRRHNAGVEELTTAVREGDPEAVVEFFSAALASGPAALTGLDGPASLTSGPVALTGPGGPAAGPDWSGELPGQISAAYDRAARQLVVDWELPGFDVVPAIRAVRYVTSTGQDKETARPLAQRRALYREVLAQCVLLALRELFAADGGFGVLDSVVLNGFVDDHDPATGRPDRIVLATVMVTRPDFAALRLEQVLAVECLTEGLRGQLSARPDQRTAVRAGRRPDEVGAGVVSHGGDAELDLFAMDPLAFEALVADLFRAMGMRAVTTQRSGDGGVDVDAVDPTPIRGGSIVVQVKRYRNTVPPTAVRDLYGTVQSTGANKGVLVTTSGFGPGSYTFAHGKPLELVSGPELVDLLHRHGLRGRLGPGGAAGSQGGGPGSQGGAAGSQRGPAGVPGQRTAPDAVTVPDSRAVAAAAAAAGTGGSGEPGDAADDTILGVTWAGAAALDVCALVCQGQRVLSDDYFVFFNNPRSPRGEIRAEAPTAPDRAALRVAFDALPATADRLVLAAAVDPLTAAPGTDLSGFADAAIRLLDSSGTELDRLPVSDGRPGETALVLGSFRRRAGGNWEFVVGGKGYPGGLEALVSEFGIEVA
ncbi:restriction endonuclease [Streptomyces sp. NPDC057638]|uniref:restriction endonuclease n=1 Tax=Streptomyces sp. NPDC057638 TaxID=3346190 RepID=UPI0036A367E7